MPTNKKKKGKKKAATAAVASGISGARSNVDKGSKKASHNNPFTAALDSEIDPAVLPPPVVSSAEHDPVPAPHGATCWICLEGRDDDDDEDRANHENDDGACAALEPLRRNCACRGPSSGYAHLSCLSSYASARSEEIWTGRRKVAPGTNQLAFGQPWEYCPNCRQYFAGQLRIDVAYEFARSTAGMVGGLRTFRHLVARSWITKSLMGTKFEDTKADVVWKEFDALLDLIASTKMNGCYDGANVMMRLVRLHVDQLEAETHFNYGNVLYREAKLMKHRRLESSSSPTMDSEEELFKKSIRAHERAIESFEALKTSGLIDPTQMENSIVHVRSSMSQVATDFEAYNESEETGVVDESEMLRLSEQLWKTKVAERGEDSQDAIQFALLHVQKLVAATNPPKLFEAADQLQKLVVKSRRVLGPDHVMTKNVLDMYGLMQERSGTLAKNNDAVFVQILRFDEDANRYILRNYEENSETTVPPSDLILKRGTLVRCVDLKGAKHLNGRKGWVEGYDEEKERHAVGFHGEDLDSTYLVRPANLRVIFLDDV